MANNLFGGLMRGLSEFIPQDDPKMKVFSVQSELSGLKEKENNIYMEIGKEVVAVQGLEAFPKYREKLMLIQSNIRELEDSLNEAKAQKEMQEKQAKEEAAKKTCPNCGHVNPEGTKFCQECGGAMVRKEMFCPQCGAKLEGGTRFCGNCGSKVTE